MNSTELRRLSCASFLTAWPLSSPRGATISSTILPQNDSRRSASGRVGQGGLEPPGDALRVVREPEVYRSAQRLSLPRDSRVVDPRPEMLQHSRDRLPVFGGSGLDPQSAIVQVLDAVAAHEGRAGQVDLARKVGELPA